MTDDAAQQPAQAMTPPSPAVDPLASLEELLNKAKSKRAAINPNDDAISQASPAPAGPTPEETQAQQLAEQQAQLAIQEEQGEAVRLEQLAAQRQKMSEELQNTPEYQARQEQNQEEEKKEEEHKAAQQGHVIHQISDAKI